MDRGALTVTQQVALQSRVVTESPGAHYLEHDLRQLEEVETVAGGGCVDDHQVPARALLDHMTHLADHHEVIQAGQSTHQRLDSVAAKEAAVHAPRPHDTE